MAASVTERNIQDAAWKELDYQAERITAHDELTQVSLMELGAESKIESEIIMEISADGDNCTISARGFKDSQWLGFAHEIEQAIGPEKVLKRKLTPLQKV